LSDARLVPLYGTGMRVDRRPAQDGDQRIAREIHHRAFRDVVERQFGQWDEALQDKFFDSEWSRQAHEVLVLDGTTIGYAAVEDRDDHILIHNLVLDPALQGRGIGTTFLAEVVQIASETSRPVRLQVLHENRAASLYRQLGFTETARTPTHLTMERQPG